MRPALLASLLVLACRPAIAPPVDVGGDAAPTPAVDAATPEQVEPEPTTTPATTRTREDDALWLALGGDAGPKRAVVMRRGELQLANEGPVALVGDGGPAFETLPVLASAGERLRVVIEARNVSVRLAVWIDAQDLAPQLQREVALGPESGTPKAGDGAVELAPGEEVEIIARRDPRVQVRTSDQRFSGWIDASALGPTYETKAFALPMFDVRLPGKTPIAVRPGGRVLHRLAANGGKWEAHALGEPKGGWLEVEHVEVCHATVRVRGYVRNKVAERVTPDAGGFGCGSGYGSASMPWGELEKAEIVKLAVDAPLYSPTGALVGRTMAAVELRRGPDGLTRVPTAWGFLPVRS